MLYTGDIDMTTGKALGTDDILLNNNTRGKTIMIFLLILTFCRISEYIIFSGTTSRCFFHACIRIYICVSCFVLYKYLNSTGREADIATESRGRRLRKLERRAGERGWEERGGRARERQRKEERERERERSRARTSPPHPRPPVPWRRCTQSCRAHGWQGI